MIYRRSPLDSRTRASPTTATTTAAATSEEEEEEVTVARREEDTVVRRDQRSPSEWAPTEAGLWVSGKSCLKQRLCVHFGRRMFSGVVREVKREGDW